MTEQTQMPITLANQTTPEQDFDKASSARSVPALLEVGKNNYGTPVGSAALGLADHLYKTSKEFDNLVAPIEKAGGVASPEGRIEAVKIFKSSQNDPTLGEVLMHYFTGNAEYARDLVTGGKVTTNTVVDKNGKMIKVWSNAFGPTRAREHGSDVDMSEIEFQDRGVGRQKYEDTLTYLGGKQLQEQNIKDWQAKIQRDSEAEQTYEGVIAPLAARMAGDLEFVKDLDISPEEKAKIFKFTNSAYSASSSAAESASFFDQQQAQAGANAGKELTEKQIVQAGLPAGLYKWTKEGVKDEKSGETFSFDHLRNQQSTSSKSNQLSNQYKQDQAALTKYLRTSGLDANTQNRVLRVFDAGKEIGQTMLKLQSEGKLPKFLAMPNTSEEGDPYALLQGKTIQLLTNQKLLQLNREYSKKAKDLAEKDGAISNPFEIEVGLTRTPEFKAAISQGMKATNDIIDRYVKTRTAKQSTGGDQQTGAIAPPVSAGKPVGIGAAPPMEPVEQDVLAKQASIRGQLGGRGAPAFDEHPGYSYSNKRDADGNKLYTKNGDKSGKTYVFKE